MDKQDMLRGRRFGGPAEFREHRHHMGWGRRGRDEGRPGQPDPRSERQEERGPRGEDRRPHGEHRGGPHERWFERHQRREARRHGGPDGPPDRGWGHRGGPPDRGGPGGPGGPGGRGRPDWPWGRRGGPKVGRGDVRAATLTLLAEQPLHGYEIIQQITTR